MSEINEIKKLPTPEIKLSIKKDSESCGETPEVNIFDSYSDIEKNSPSPLNKEFQALLEGFYDAFEEYRDTSEFEICPPEPTVTTDDSPSMEPPKPYAPDSSPKPSAPVAPSKSSVSEECPPEPTVTTDDSPSMEPPKPYVEK